MWYFLGHQVNALPTFIEADEAMADGVLYAGMGKSRALDVLAATSYMAGTSEQSTKMRAIEAFQNELPDEPKRPDFARRMTEAYSVSVTFGSKSQRRDDVDLIPEASEALAMRFLWSYFCNTTATTWKTFVNRVSLPELDSKDVVRWILEDLPPGTDVIFCVDELMLSGDGKPRQQLTSQVSYVLSSLGAILDAERRVHIVMSIIQCKPLIDMSTLSCRDFFPVCLPRISQ
jgi:hypothetical protein